MAIFAHNNTSKDSGFTPSQIVMGYAPRAPCFIQIACDDSNLKNSEAWESPGPLRLLPIFQIFKRTLGLWESPGGPAKSWVIEATDISRGHRVTGTSGKSQWPGKVLGH